MNKYIIKNIQAIYMSSLLYWGTDYQLNWIFWTGTTIFFIMLNIFAYLQSKEMQDK
jgi:hypothetical protein